MGAKEDVSKTVLAKADELRASEKGRLPKEVVLKLAGEVSASSTLRVP